MYPERLYELAIHEAGHAVAAFLCGKPFLRIELYSEGGHIVYPKRKKWFRTKKELEDFVRVSLAGRAAQMISDDSDIGKVKARVYSGGDFIGLADCLGRQLVDHDDLDEVFKPFIESREMEFVSTLLAMNWTFVEAVANALLEKKKLTKRQVAAIFCRGVTSWA